MNYWKFIYSESPEQQEGWPKGQEGFLEGEEDVNFEDQFFNAMERYGVELDRDRNLTPISKLVPATVKDLKWDNHRYSAFLQNVEM